jgi:hypothetical protein
MERREVILQAAERGEAVNNNTSFDVEMQMRGQEKLNPQSHAETHTDAIVREAQQRRAERRMSDAEIYHEFKSIFVRLKRQHVTREKYSATRLIGEPGHRFPNPKFDQSALNAMPTGIDLAWTAPKPKHKEAAAKLFREIGRTKTLRAWENFLVEGGDFEVPQSGGTEQRTWLLLHFVEECGEDLRKENENV